MQTILDAGVRIVVALQGLGAWPFLPMNFFSFLGTANFFMLVLPILYWCMDSHLGICLAITLMASTTLNSAFKLAFHGPRPYWYNPTVSALSTETSFGVPSNHAQNAVVVWGLLAAYLRKWWGWLVAILIILSIGLSRIYLGVHFPHDVLLGWLIGGLILWLVLRYWRPVVASAQKPSTGLQILTAFLASLVAFLLPFIPFTWLKVANWQPSQDWAMFATQAISLQDGSTCAGTIFGMLIGWVWLRRQGGFQTKGIWWKLVLRYLMGVAGVLIISIALKYILPAGESAFGYFFLYLRYALIGFWVIGGAPWIFIRVKLADKLD